MIEKSTLNQLLPRELEIGKTYYVEVDKATGSTEKQFQGLGKFLGFSTRAHLMCRIFETQIGAIEVPAIPSIVRYYERK